MIGSYYYYEEMPIHDCMWSGECYTCQSLASMDSGTIPITVGGNGADISLGAHSAVPALQHHFAISNTGSGDSIGANVQTDEDYDTNDHVDNHRRHTREIQDNNAIEAPVDGHHPEEEDDGDEEEDEDDNDDSQNPRGQRNDDDDHDNDDDDDDDEEDEDELYQSNSHSSYNSHLASQSSNKFHRKQASRDLSKAQVYKRPSMKDSTNKQPVGSGAERDHGGRLNTKDNKKLRHREVEKNRHRQLQAMVKTLSEKIPGRLQKETQVQTMKRAARYCVYLRDILNLMAQGHNPISQELLDKLYCKSLEHVEYLMSR